MFLSGSISPDTNLLTPTSDKKREASPAHPADSENFPFLFLTGLLLPFLFMQTSSCMLTN